MDALTPTVSLAPHPDVVWRLVEGEVVLLNVSTGQYYSLDEVGSRVWALLPQAGISLAALRDQVIEEFEVDPETVDRDLRDLFTRMLTAELVVTLPPTE